MKIYQMNDFTKFYSKISQTEMPFKLAYKFSKIANKITEETSFFQEQMQKIIEECGKRDSQNQFIYSEDGTQILIDESKLDLCHRKMNDLGNVDIIIPGISFTLDELDFITLTPSEIQLFESFITE